MTSWCLEECDFCHKEVKLPDTWSQNKNTKRHGVDILRPFTPALANFIDTKKRGWDSVSEIQVCKECALKMVNYIKGNIMSEVISH